MSSLKSFFYRLAMLSFLLSTTTVYSIDYSISMGSAVTEGQTAYDIGISLLEFPVASTVSQTVAGTLLISDRLTASIYSASAQSNQQSKKFLDSDFRVPNDRSTLYIYSESDNDVKHQTVSIDLDYVIYHSNSTQYTMGFGYTQQKFDYRVYNVHQWLVGVPNSDQYVNDVTALTYNSVESIPYLSVGFIKDWSSLSIGFETQFSPLVSYKGHDNHVLRSKHINFSGKGQYVNIAINLQYEISSNWSMSMGYAYSYTETYGEHTQTRYASTLEGPTGVLGDGTQTSITELSSFNASLSYQF